MFANNITFNYLCVGRQRCMVTLLTFTHLKFFEARTELPKDGNKAERIGLVKLKWGLGTTKLNEDIIF